MESSASDFFFLFQCEREEEPILSHLRFVHLTGEKKGVTSEDRGMFDRALFRVHLVPDRRLLEMQIEWPDVLPGHLSVSHPWETLRNSATFEIISGNGAFDRSIVHHHDWRTSVVKFNGWDWAHCESPTPVLLEGELDGKSFRQTFFFCLESDPAPLRARMVNCDWYKHYSGDRP